MTEITRLPDWRARLEAYLDSIEGRPFAWGDLDCALFAADCVLAMTGVDFANDFRGKYTDYASGLAALKAAGFKSYAGIVSNCLPQAQPDEVGIGDIAVVDIPPARLSLALVGGAHLTVMTEAGKGSLPLDRASRFFKVG